MKYSRTALKILKARYLSVLRKCVLINAGLFVLAMPAAAAQYDFDKFNDFKTEWEKDTEGDIFNLTGNLTADSSLKDRDKNFTINGNNYIFDLNGQNAKIQHYSASGTINDLKIKNAKNTAIDISSGNGSIDNVVLENNVADTETDASVINVGRYAKLLNLTNSTIQYNNGRAIYVSGDPGTIWTVENINNTSFFNNHAGEGKNGGAIFMERTSSANEINADFIYNEAWDGGAIYVKRNKASGWGYEAASISSLKGNFEGNTAYGSGGAIYNQGTINSLQGKFIGNSAENQGGAIYNTELNSYRASLNIQSSSENNTLFRGNRDANGSNAIYNNKADITLSAGKDSFIIFDDAVSGNEGSINISGSGTVEFNNTVSGNNINLNDGILKLGSYAGGNVNGQMVAASNGNFDNTVNFNVNGGQLNLQDEAIRSTNLGNLNLTTDLQVDVDIALAGAQIDNITADSFADNGHQINISELQIIEDSDKNITEIKLPENSLYNLSSLKNTAITVGDKVKNNYLMTYNDGILKFGNDKSLETAVQFENADCSFVMGEDETLTGNLGVLTGSALSISSAGHSVNGNGFSGIEINRGQELNILDTSFKGFDGAAIDNNGILQIAAKTYDITFDSEISGNGIINADGQQTLVLNKKVSAKEFNLLSGDLKLGNGNVLNGVENFKVENGVFDIVLNQVKLQNATFEQDSTLAVNVNNTENGLLSVENLTVKDGATLKATLAQGLVDEASGPKEFTLIEAENWIEGDNFTPVQDNNMYRFERGENNGKYVVSLTQTAEEVSQGAGGTRNNAGTAQAWVDGEGFSEGSTEQKIADRLAGLAQNNSEKFNQALTALAPEVSPVVKTIMSDHNNQVFSAISTRMTGGSFGMAVEGKASGDSRIERGALWAQLLANKTNFSGNHKTSGFDSKSTGAALGAEKYISESIKTGLGYAYTNGDIDSFMRDTDVDTHTVFAYGEYKPSNWFANGMVAYSFSDYEERKHVAGDSYKAKYDVDSLGLQVMGGYDAAFSKVKLTPQAGLRYNNIHRDSYTDSAGQNVAGDKMDILTSVAGIKLYKEFETDNGSVWKPEARLAITYDLISDKENAVVSLANGSSYFVEGERLDRFGIEFGARVTAEIKDKIEFSLGYEGKFRDNYEDHTGLLNAKYKF